MRPGLLAATALLAVAVPVTAQTASPAIPAQQPGPTPDVPPDESTPAILAPGDAVDFEADQLTYDDSAQIVTATGRVQMRRDGYRLQADSVEYNRSSGVVTAIGHVITTDPGGNQALGDRVELTESLRDGAIDNILLVLNDGGRLAAVEGQRSEQIITLKRAVYSPCAVVDKAGCPQDPVWRIKAVRISYDRNRHRISYRKASLEMFGVPVFYLPSFSHPDGEAKQVSGLLVPGIEIQRQLGLGVSLPFHLAQAPDRDYTLTPWFYTGTNPALAFQGRRLLRDGPIQIDGIMTYARRIDFAPDGVTEIDQGNQFRGYVGIKGQLQHNPLWRSTFSVRLTTDDTFNRRYGLDFDDTLRSTYALERVTPDSWLSISAWGFQGLRATDIAGQIPFVLPLIDYDWRPQREVLGGRFHLGANSMNLMRTDGQDVFRALAFGRWDRSVLTGLGQRITATGLLRGDVYNVMDAGQGTLPEYAGQAGISGRVIPVAALDVEWPFAGPLLGGTQTITPRMQLVAAPDIENSAIPNEDSRAIELEDISLFDLSRFPGWDRFEGGSRITYGVEYALDRPGWQLRSEIGQSVRLHGRGEEFPEGTGLSDRVSDFVGRTTLKIGRLVELAHRFRVDKDSFAVRRNEIDMTIGSRRTYAQVGYVRLNRNITLEDLEDREELRLGGRASLARFWTVFGTMIVDLTTTRDNPLATGDGFTPIRHRLGLEYEDECFRVGVSWRRDYVGDRDFRPGNVFQVNLAFKTLGG